MATDVKNRKNLLDGKKPQKLGESLRERACFAASKEDEYSFLNFQFHDIPVVDLPETNKPFGQVTEGGHKMWDIGYGVKVNADENIETLAGAVETYCRINGKEFKFSKTNNPTHDLSLLLAIANDANETDSELVLDYNEKEKQVVVIEYAQCDFDYCTVFFLPVSFIEKLPENLKPTLLEACRYVICVCGLNEPSEHMDLAVALGEWGEEYLDDVIGEDIDDDDSKEYREYIENYRSGDIAKLIESAADSPKDKNEIKAMLEKALPEYIDTKYERLLLAFKDGINLHQGDYLQNYYISPQQCTIEDFDNSEAIIDMARLFAVVYDYNDPIAERAIDALNGDCGSLEVEAMYDRRILTKDLTEKLTPSEFPRKWCRWFGNLINCIQAI